MSIGAVTAFAEAILTLVRGSSLLWVLASSVAVGTFMTLVVIMITKTGAALAPVMVKRKPSLRSTLVWPIALIVAAAITTFQWLLLHDLERAFLSGSLGGILTLLFWRLLKNNS
jgi:hypothetical protein